MANTPRLPKDLKTDLNAVNEQLQGISEKMMNIVDLGSTFKINSQPVDDLAHKFAGIAQINTKLSKSLLERHNSERDISKTLAVTSRQLDKTDKAHGKALSSFLKAEQHILATQKAGLTLSKKDVDNFEKKRKKAQDLGESLTMISKEYKSQKEALNGLDSKWTVIAKVIGNEVLGGLDKMGKALVAFGIDSVITSLTLVKGGVERIYDLMQRTVKATGEFNERLGGTTTGLRELQKEGWQLEGALRGLSDAGLGIGLKELQEATQAFGFADKALSKFRVTAVLAGKAMGIGSAAAGEMARTFKTLGQDAGTTAQSFVEISDAANRAGVPVSDFAKEIVSSKNFLASFGRAGRKVFLESAAFAKKLGVSLAGLQKFTDLTDTFESTAEAAAKMNTVFGTNINSMELMLEQDPSKRIEMVRRSFRDQGKTFESMSRQERKFFATTLQLSEEESAAILESGLTLDEFNKKRQKQAKTEAQAQKEIQRGLQKTVSTLNNWSLTFDNITRAFMPLLKDLTDFLGITVKIDKATGDISTDWKSFASRVEQVVGRIRVFFGMMEKNEKVQKLIATISEDFKGMFNAFTATGPEADKRMGQLVDTIGEAAGVAKTFYDTGKQIFNEVITKENMELGMEVFKFLANNIGKITIGLLAVKGALGAMTIISGLSSVVSLLVGTGGFTAAMTAVAGAIMSPIGIVAALGAAAVAAAYFVGKTKTVSDGMVGFYESLDSARGKFDGFFSDLSDGLKKSALGKMIFGEGNSFDDIRKQLGDKGINPELLSMLSKQLTDNIKGRGGEIARPEEIRQNAKLFAEYLGQSENTILSIVEKQQDKNKLIRQGLRVAPQDSDFVKFPGTASPSSVAEPVSAVGGSTTSPSAQTTNFANKPAKAKAAASNVNIVAGDVYLDGNLVGRHLGRLAYEG